MADFNDTKSMLQNIVTEAEHLANSGEARLAGEGRRTLIFAEALLKIVEAHGEAAFNEIKVEAKHDFSDTETQKAAVASALN